MRNQQLYEALKEYCKATLAYLQTKMKTPEDLPTTIREKFEVTDSGEISQFYVTEVEWWRLVLKNEQTIKQMDVYQRATQAMEEDKEIAKHLNTLVGTEEARRRVDADSCSRFLLTQLLQKQQGLDFQEIIFDEVYKRIEDYFYRDSVEYRCSSPLNNFQMETESIQLSSKFSIIKIPGEEREKTLSQSSQFGLFSPYQVMPFNEYAFEFYLEVPKVIGEGSSFPKEENMPSQVARKQFDKACSALRLFKNGAVSYDYIRMGTASWELHGGSFTVSSIVSSPSIGARYTLSKEEIPNLLKFWDFFQGARQKKQNRIEIALRRFNFSYERARPEDKLIDYLIGFEALLLKGGERQELEYRLALRGSTLLGKSSGDREKIFEELKVAYRERSNIVHGGSIRPGVKVATEKVQFNDFVNRIEERLRSAIKEFFVEADTQSELQVIKDLDKRIICSSDYRGL